MPIISRIKDFSDDLVKIRRDFHEHPELGMQEVRTSRIVNELLEKWGLETFTGIGKTGVVGVLKGNKPGKTIGLRADMDALPIQEKTNLAFASKNPGIMHACGHDSHTTMLLGAARYLSENKDFSGTAIFIFQPAEEGLGGAKAMLADKLFERFPCDEIYGLHNWPTGELGKVTIKPGVAMAGADFFDIQIKAFGSHAARPHASKDPIIIASSLIAQLQTIVSRNVPPTETIVLSITQIHAGTAYNVIPSECVLSGTMRYFDNELAKLVRKRIKAIVDGVAKAFDVEIEIDNREIFDVLVNNEKLSHEMLKVASEVVGKENASIREELVTGSEDFADMLNVIPGAYCNIGHGGTLPLHNDGFILDENILPIGASIYAKLVETRG